MGERGAIAGAQLPPGGRHLVAFVQNLWLDAGIPFQTHLAKGSSASSAHQATCKTKPNDGASAGCGHPGRLI